MGGRSDPKCLPKRFCCCLKLKYGVILACTYLIIIGTTQFLSLFGNWDLGYNTLLTFGDLLLGGLAIFCILTIKKFKMGAPLKILACLWLVMTIMTMLSYYESVYGTEGAIESIEEIEEQQKEKMAEITSTIQLSKTQITTMEENSDVEEFANESLKKLEDWKKNLSEAQANVIFGLWNLFKIYNALCILKLGLKIERKYRKNVFFKLR